MYIGERTILAQEDTEDQWYVTSAGTNFPSAFTSEAMTAAVETQMNFVIQNALFFLQNKE